MQFPSVVRRPVFASLGLLVVLPFAGCEAEEDATADDAGQSYARVSAVAGKDTSSGTVGELMWLDPGIFVMGSRAKEPGRDADEVRHTVKLDHGFWMMEIEVTQDMWFSIMGTDPSYNVDCGGRCPVEQVTWDDAVNFAEALSELDGVAYRLPTEAEWEYAARGGADEVYAGGDGAGWLAWTRGNSEGHPRIGCRKDSNDFGLCDMSGNVAEWTADWYGDYELISVRDPAGPEVGTARVRRGGSYAVGREYARVANRAVSEPDVVLRTIGFRLVMEIE